MSAILAVLFAFQTAPVIQVPKASELTNEQVAIIYDQCLARAAAKASRTDAPAEKIYDIAKTSCAGPRTMLSAGHEATSDRVKMLNAIDEERAASFPERTRKLREMIATAKLQDGTPN